MEEFLKSLVLTLIFSTPLVFIAGIFIAAINKKIELYMILGSVIVFFIGLGICFSNFKI